MMISRRFLNFAAASAFAAALMFLSACEGRTSKNMVPTGDTVEVVINAPTEVQDSLTQNIE